MHCNNEGTESENAQSNEWATSLRENKFTCHNRQLPGLHGRAAIFSGIRPAQNSIDIRGEGVTSPAIQNWPATHL